MAADQRSLSQPRLTVGSPDHRISRKLSPVEIYYEMRTRRNSVTSSVRYRLTHRRFYVNLPLDAGHTRIRTPLPLTAQLTLYQEVRLMLRVEVFQLLRSWPELLQ